LQKIQFSEGASTLQTTDVIAMPMSERNVVTFGWEPYCLLVFTAYFMQFSRRGAVILYNVISATCRGDWD